MKAKILTFINEKGGVGKTSVAFNSAWELANRGKKVLILDFDGQKANMSFFLGIQNAQVKTIADVLKSGVDIHDAILQVKENLDVVPANVSVSDLGMDAKISKLRVSLKGIQNQYDYIFIDVNPSPGWAHYLSLSVSDFAVVVMLPDVASLEGNNGILESIMEIQETTNTRLQIAGILFNRHDSRPSLTRQVQEVAEMMASNAETKLFKTKIPQAVALSECVAMHEGITSYDKSSKAAKAVMEFVDELEMRVR